MFDSERKALVLVRLIAVAALGFGIINILLYWFQCSSHHESMQPFKVVLSSWPLALGLIIFIKARALAEWLNDWLEM